VHSHLDRIGVVIMPLLPGINDDLERIATILRAAETAEAGSIEALPLHFRGTARCPRAIDAISRSARRRLACELRRSDDQGRFGHLDVS
jgi:DNA repair photolyase